MRHALLYDPPSLGVEGERVQLAMFYPKGKKKLDLERQAIRAELTQRVPEIAKDIASRVLGREIA